MGSALPAQPIAFKPLGLYDALEGGSAPPGACFSLQNLVHDVSTQFCWVPRPAVIQKTNFPSLLSPGTVSVMIAIGTRVYGMISTALNPGFDQPFCYDTATGGLVTISGISSSNVPATQATSGAWTPPCMEVFGSKIIITHPGYSGTGSNFFGVIDISTPASPAYSAQNTTTNALPSVPVWAKQFNNRIYFACNNTAYYTDSLALSVTNSSQFLTIGDSGSAITGIGGLGVQQTQGGILAAIIIFKASGYWQVTGDTATSNLVLNGPIAIGCSAPRTIQQVPTGLAFMANDGIRVIDFWGNVAPAPMPGVRDPFQSVVVPSRAAAAYNNTVYRVGIQTYPNTLSNTTAFVEYWYDFEIQQWGGPHTFCSDCVVPMGSSFICASNRAVGALYQSDVDPNLFSTATELGLPLIGILQSCMLDTDEGMAMKAIVESQINVNFGASASSLTVQFVSANYGVLQSATITPPTQTYWGQFIWGKANWAGAPVGLRTFNIDWPAPVVYKNGGVSITTTLSKGLRIGPIRLRVEELDYMNEQSPA